MTETAPELSTCLPTHGLPPDQTTPQPQAANPLKTRINKDNARLLALRSWELRRAAKLNPPPPEPPEPALEASKPAPNDDYLSKRLKTVRTQLDRIDGLMTTEEDPQRLDRLASAQSRLAEQERLLANRPMPGSLRPTGEPTRRRGSLVDDLPSPPSNGASQAQE